MLHVYNNMNLLRYHPVEWVYFHFFIAMIQVLENTFWDIDLAIFFNGQGPEPFTLAIRAAAQGSDKLCRGESFIAVFTELFENPLGRIPLPFDFKRWVWGSYLGGLRVQESLLCSYLEKYINIDEYKKLWNP